MAAKKAITILVSASLALSLCPLPRLARASETVAEEGQADALAFNENDVEGVEPNTEEGAPTDVSTDDEPLEEDVEPNEDMVSPEEDAARPVDDASVEATAQSEEGTTPKGKAADPELTVWLQSDAGLPSQFDLRDRGVVTPVKKQSPWGYCWAHGAIAAAETSILTTMGSTYAETGLDLSERHLAWYAASPVTEAISQSQAGEGLYPYDTSMNSVFDFGGREQCAATLFAQGIGPMPESDYPCQGANGTLASDDYPANRETYIQEQTEYYTANYWYLSDEEARSYAEQDYNSLVETYQTYDAYSPFDDWSITEQDEPGSGRLRGSAYTLTDNNVFSYWARLDDDQELDTTHFHKQPLCTNGTNAIWQDTIDLIKTEIYEGRGVSVGTTIKDETLNTETWSAYDPTVSVASDHVVCIVGWDDDYAASNFTETPPGNGAWIAKNSWGSETDAVAGGLTAADGTPKDAHADDWGIVDENGKHTGYYYISYYDGTVNVPETFSFEIEPNNDQQDALQLDYLPASAAEFFHVDENPSKEANVFTLDKDMRIDEVATRLRISSKTPIQDFTCTFDLYKLRDGATKPDDGTLLSTLTRTFQTQGYHRVALDAPIYLKKGDRLGIVVQQTHVADDGTTLYGIEAQETTSYQANPRLRRDPVYGTVKVNEGESFYYIEGLTSEDEGSVDGWLDIMAPLSEEILRYFKSGESEILLKYYISKACGNPMRDFFNIDNFGIKAFGEPASLEHVDAVAATCEETGQVEYWVDPQTGTAYADENGTKILEDISVPPLDHAWGKATYAWSKDGKTCTAKRVCKNDQAHVQTVKAKVTSKVTKKPTATKAGTRTYTAKFDVSWAKTKTKTKAIPATGMPTVSGKAYLQGTGWSSYIAGGKVVGTTGEARRLEALRLKLKGADVTGGIEYRAHIQSLGWEKTWARDGKTSGTTGKAKRLEAVQIRLYGKMAKQYDVYYRVHVRGLGWMAWAKNGAKAGTTGMSRRAEAVQVVLVEKGAKAPGKTYKGVKQSYAKAFIKQ